MKVKLTETKTKEVEVITEMYTLCDKCDEKIKLDNYDAFEFELIYKTGYSFPEGGGGDKLEMHLCDNCAENCIDLLKNNGYRINKFEWDF